MTESSLKDEEDVLSLARKYSGLPKGDCVHTTVIGIGVDLSVNTVEKLSAIGGAKYASVLNTKEFLKTIVEEVRV